MIPIVIRNPYALGDTVCLSATIRDLHRAHPGKYRVSVAGNYSSYWKHCSLVHPIDPKLNAPVYPVQYKDGIGASQSGKYRGHFLAWMHRWLGRQLKCEIPVSEPKGEIYLSPEHERRLFAGRYWVVVAGGKTDITAKWWLFARWQNVVDELAARNIRCVQAGANFHLNLHPKLLRCESAIGRTDDIADLFALIKYSEGVICGVTAAMHIAAVFDKPCVVVAGGREEPTWEAYTNDGQWPEGCAPVKIPHRFLHTITMLDCCKNFGCWRKRTVAIEKADLLSVQSRNRLCSDPVRGKQTVPRCMTLVTVPHVVGSVMAYYREGRLPPVGEIAGEPAVIPPEMNFETNRPVPTEITEQATRRGENPSFAVLDHPTIGGKYTIFILCHGNYFALAKKCLESVLNTVPLSRIDLRIGLNQVCRDTLDYCAELVRDGIVTKIYSDTDARRKYPAMRAMFGDTECAVKTRYLIWFDDDATIIDKQWLPKLTETIIANHPNGSRLYGAKFVHDLTSYASNGHRPDLWFRQATWWRNREFQLRGKPGRTGPNGSVIEFVSGWFWALHTDTMRAGDIPDARLNHNGGDITIGAQVHQLGGKIKEWNRAKASVWCPERDKGGRRGYADPCFPWAQPV